MVAEPYSGQSVVVTGAQGFVGGWLAERLLDAGAHVVVPHRDVPPDSRFRSEGIDARCDVVAADLIDAYLLMGKSLDRPELRGRAWNAGSGRAVAVLEFVRALIRVSGRDTEPEVRGEGTPAGEIDRQVLDATAIREELGWEARVGLEQGLARTWAWYEDRLAR